LAEGAEVEVTPLESRADDPPFLQALLKLAKRRDWPADFAPNHAHYTKGHPRLLASDRRAPIFRRMAEVTQLLNGLAAGEPQAADQLLLLVYDELRKLAAAKMAHEAPGQTLQPTALVHEAWLRLAGQADPSWRNRRHFFSAAAEAMRRILIERARHRRRHKHGGGLQRVNVDELDLATVTDDETLLRVNEAIEKLNAVDPVGAELIRLRFFAGLSNVDAAELINLPERTAKRTWAYARAWLYEELRRQG
jgi:RNA polymerase sigma factor (TIGR02999 family)